MKKIELTKNKFALVDNEDYEFLLKFNFYLSKYFNFKHALSDKECSI
jgi:hypothetical protein